MSWSRDWTGTSSNRFTATIYDDNRRLCTIIRFKDGTVNVMPVSKEANKYDVITSLKENGSVSVTVMNDAGYLEIVEVRGRDTCLKDDLEYMQTAMGLELIAKPLVKSITDEIQKKPEGAKE